MVIHKLFVSVSVIIPCYRCADTIERAVKSVAEQSQKPYEVILVDDCSGDNTLQALNELQAEYGADTERERLRNISIFEGVADFAIKNDFKVKILILNANEAVGDFDVSQKLSAYLSAKYSRKINLTKSV